MSEREGSARGGKALGTISLKQVRVSRGDMDARASNPMNRLVPYLDLFSRLTDAELARLAVVGADVVAGLRTQVEHVERALARYTDLLPRLADEELVRLTGASAKTIRFWRLCQPRKDGKPPGPAKSTARPTPSPKRVPTPTASPPPPAGATPLSKRPLVAKPEIPEEAAVARVIRARQETAPHQVVDPPASEDTHPRAKRPTKPSPAAEDTPSSSRSGSGTQPQIEIQGSPFPGYDYDPTEPIPDELVLDLPELGDL